MTQKEFCNSIRPKADIGRRNYRMPSAEMTQTVFFVARYMASAGPIFAGEHTFGFGSECLHEQAVKSVS